MKKWKRSVFSFISRFLPKKKHAIIIPRGGCITVQGLPCGAIFRKPGRKLLTRYKGRQQAPEDGSCLCATQELRHNSAHPQLRSFPSPPSLGEKVLSSGERDLRGKTSRVV